jgi:superoxide dismutase, Fe-Mn family
MASTAPRRYSVAPLFCRPWTLNGISPRLIESHYEHIYGTAVVRLNDISDAIGALDPAVAPPDVIAHLKRDELTALNSTLLHELYFASLGGDGRAVPERMASALSRDFGSMARWRAEFIALGESLAAGSGWVLLSYVPRDRRLVNHLGADHDHGVTGGIPILALDMYEHAYQLEFGANAAAYVAAFMRNIDWSAVMARLDDVVKVPPPPSLIQQEFGNLPAITVDELRDMLAAGTSVQVIDTRPRHYSSRAHEIVEGAVWRDPERIEDWIGELAKDKPVVTFCVYGFHIGCQTAAVLREAGFDARYMAGGHFAWKAAGGPTRLFDPASASARPVGINETTTGRRDLKRSVFS